MLYPRLETSSRAILAWVSPLALSVLCTSCATKPNQIASADSPLTQLSRLVSGGAPTYLGPGTNLLVVPLLSAPEATAAGFYAGWLYLRPGTRVPEHVHANSTEILFPISGGGTLTLGSTSSNAAPNAKFFIASNQLHSAGAGHTGLLLLQFYTPPDAGMRFYKWPMIEWGHYKEPEQQKPKP